jgi:hypothetical protein
MPTNPVITPMATAPVIPPAKPVFTVASTNNMMTPMPPVGQAQK